MTLRYLLDTNIVSAPVRKTPDADIVARLEKEGHQCAIGAPIWHELVYGCSRLTRGKRRNTIEAYLQDVVRTCFPILPYDESGAAWHASQRVRLERSGRPTPYVDGQIAAIAHSNGLILVTANVKDFARFKGLKVENWSKRSARSG